MPLVDLRSRVAGDRPTESRRFECCDTSFEIHAEGWGRERAVTRAVETARDLERQLNAFDEDSAVARLNRAGEVTNRHVARLVHRGLEYGERTDGVFDVVNGQFEHDLKAYLRGDRASPPGTFQSGTIQRSGATVRADVKLDLNGLAKGYVVDRVHEALVGRGRRGYVNGGGDVAGRAGHVGIESPYGDSGPLKTLHTDWNVATSAGYNRRRSGVDHVYDPREGRVGSRHDLVTVVAERDCTEADALATAVAAMPLADALTLVDEWDGAEAFVVHQGVFHRTEGFTDHVAAE